LLKVFEVERGYPKNFTQLSKYTPIHNKILIESFLKERSSPRFPSIEGLHRYLYYMRKN
jgi:hypothetical protein